MALPRILLALALSMTLVFASVAPAEATKGGKRQQVKRQQVEQEVLRRRGGGGRAEGEGEEGGCGSGTWIAFPLLGGIVLVRRRRTRSPS